jgi:S-adenosylmethionine-dependent methyltransferase
MTTDHDRVRAYYAAFDEWARLESPEGALEFRRAAAVLRAHLAPGSRILDLGGGAGRYAFELASRGHRVVLADLSPTLLETARGKAADLGIEGAIESFDEVNATDLGRYQDQSFDAVVAFGPFYHLLEAAERRAAAGEIRRVLRAGGLAFIAFIPRLSGIVGLIRRAVTTPEQVPPGALSTAAAGGTFRNGSRSGFQEGHYLTPDEIRQLFQSVDFEILDALSLRSIGDRLERELARLPAQLAAEIDHLIDDLARDPAILATGGHAILVARRG